LINNFLNFENPPLVLYSIKKEHFSLKFIRGQQLLKNLLRNENGNKQAHGKIPSRHSWVWANLVSPLPSLDLLGCPVNDDEAQKIDTTHCKNEFFLIHI